MLVRCCHAHNGVQKLGLFVASGHIEVIFKLKAIAHLPVALSSLPSDLTPPRRDVSNNWTMKMSFRAAWQLRKPRSDSLVLLGKAANTTAERLRFLGHQRINSNP